MNGIGKTREGPGAHEAGPEQGRAEDPGGEEEREEDVHAGDSRFLGC